MFSMMIVWIHILAAMFWIGGMLFFSLILVPSLGGMPRSERIELMSRIGLRYRKGGWISLAILLTTGLIRLHQLNWVPLTGGGWIWAKLALIFLMLIMTLLHDLLLGPQAIQISRSSAAPHPLQKKVRWMARLNLLIGLFIVFAAIYVARGY